MTNGTEWTDDSIKNLKMKGGLKPLGEIETKTSLGAAAKRILGKIVKSIFNTVDNILIYRSIHRKTSEEMFRTVRMFPSVCFSRLYPRYDSNVSDATQCHRPFLLSVVEGWDKPHRIQI